MTGSTSWGGGMITFRQRVGKIDWKQLTSTNIEAIVTQSKITELQSVLDLVVFSQFSIDDAKHNSVDSIAKLVQLLQLVSEYLLQSQEAQFKVIRDLDKKSNAISKAFSKLQRQNASLQEDIKIYQRQITMLRQSLQKTQEFLIASPTDGGGHRYDPITGRPLGILPLPPAIRNGGTADGESKGDGNAGSNYNNNSSNNNNVSAKMLESMLQNEKELRKFMGDVLEDQRRTFTEELDTLRRALYERERSNAAAPAGGGGVGRDSMTDLFDRHNAALVNNMKEELVAALQSALEPLSKQQQQQPQKPISSSAAAMSQRSDKDVQSIIRASVDSVMRKSMNFGKSEATPVTAASGIPPLNRSSSSFRPTQQQQFGSVSFAPTSFADEHRPLQLEQREEELREREALLVAREEKAAAALAHAGGLSSSTTLNRAVKRREDKNKRASAIRIMRAAVNHAMHRREARAFHLWASKMIQARNNDFLNEQSILMTFAEDKYKSKQEDMKISLQRETNMRTIAENRLDSVTKELEVVRADLQSFAQKSTAGASRREKELLAQMRLEQEKAAIAQAKYEGFVKEAERELLAYQDKLLDAEERLQRALQEHELREDEERIAVLRNKMDANVMTSFDDRTKWPASSSPSPLRASIGSAVSRHSIGVGSSSIFNASSLMKSGTLGRGSTNFQRQSLLLGKLKEEAAGLDSPSADGSEEGSEEEGEKRERLRNLPQHFLRESVDSASLLKLAEENVSTHHGTDEEINALAMDSLAQDLFAVLHTN